MNVFLPSSDRSTAMGDAEALSLMLDYIAAEAYRLGFSLCACHAESAREAIAYECEPATRYRS